MGIVVAGTGVPVQIGNVHSPTALLGIAGFVLTAVLLQRNVRGAILIGMVVTAAAGIAIGAGHAPRALVALPFRGEYDVSAIALKLDVLSVLRLGFLPVLLTLFLMSL